MSSRMDIILFIHVGRQSLIHWSEDGDADLTCSNVSQRKRRPLLQLLLPLLLLGERTLVNQTQWHKQRRG